MTEQSSNAREFPRSPHFFVKHRPAIVSSAAAIAITAIIGTALLNEVPLVNGAEAEGAPVQTTEINPTSSLQLPSFADLVDRVKPAVVSVYVKEGAGQTLVSNLPNGESQNPFGPGSPFQFFFHQFGMPQPDGPGMQNGPGLQVEPRPERAQGSGFFISADGYVLTNNHVVDHAKEVEIKTIDGKSYKAKIVGTDPKTDIALLKVEGSSKFPFVSFAATKPRIGDWVLAMGNPFGLGGTVTAGIVSASGRDIGSGPYDDFIQIDAPVNQGNSGGPTFNLKGEVIGINTAIFSPSGGSVGIAFDIPGPSAKTIADELRTKGSVTRGWIGVTIQPVTRDIADSLGLKEAAGALIDEPQEGGPAAKAGLKSEDVVLSVDGDPIKDARALALKMAGEEPGRTVKLAVMRHGTQQTIDVTVAPYPNERTAENSSSSQGESPLGLTLAPADEVAGAGSRGVAVIGVDPDSAAADKGVKQGDVILDVGDKTVAAPQDVNSALKEARTDGKRTVLLRLKTAQGGRFVALPIG